MKNRKEKRGLYFSIYRKKNGQTYSGTAPKEYASR